MKKLLLVVLVAASFSGLANANSGVYASVKAGVSDTKAKDVTQKIEDADFKFLASNEKKSTYPTISAAVGFDFSTISPVNARAELEYTYKGKTSYSPGIYAVQDIDGIFPVTDFPTLFNYNITTQSLMLNGYYDFKNESKFTPYVSAGAGFTHVKNKVSSIFSDEKKSDSDNHFTWSAGVGVNYAVSKNVDLDLSYRYVDAGKLKFNTEILDTDVESNFKLVSNEYLLGIRYNF